MTGHKAAKTKAQTAGLRAAATYASVERVKRDEATTESGPLLALGKSGLGWGSMTVLLPAALWQALRIHAVTTDKEMSVLVAELVEADLVRKGLVKPGIVSAELARRPIRKAGGAA